jgi:hypothetical protein
MDHGEWKALFDAEVRRLVEERGYSEQRARFRARELTELRYGRRPRRRVQEVLMNGQASPIPVWALALIWGALGGLGAAELCLADDVITTREGVSIAYAFLVAAVAKWSNPEKVVSPKPTVK